METGRLLRLLAALAGVAGAMAANGAARAAPPRFFLEPQPGAVCGGEARLLARLGNGERVDSFGFEVTFDPEALELARVEPGTDTQGWARVAGLEVAPGRARVGGYRGAAAPLEGEELALAALVFRCREEACPGESRVEIEAAVDDLEEARLLGAFVLCAAPSPTPSVSPSATPSLTPSATPSPTPSPSPSLSPSPSPSFSPSPSPSPSVSLSLTPSPSPSLSPSPSPSPSPSASPSLTPSPSPSPSPRPTPGAPVDSDGDGYADWYEDLAGSDRHAAASRPALGDVNGDGEVNLADAVFLYRAAGAGMVIPGGRGDVNFDGAVDARDALALYHWLSGAGPCLLAPCAE